MRRVAAAQGGLADMGMDCQTTCSLLKLFFLAREQCMHRRIQFIAALEEVEFENEKVPNRRAAEFLHQRASGGCRTAWFMVSIRLGLETHRQSRVEPGRDGRGGARTSGNNVINNQHLLPALDGALLHLEEITAILLDKLGRLARPRQLAPLAHGNKSRIESQRQRGPEQEASRIEANDNVWLGAAELLDDGELEGAHEALV